VNQQNDFYKDVIPKDYPYPVFSDFKYALISMSIFILLQKVTVYLLYPFYYSVCKEKKIEKDRVRRSTKASVQTFKAAYKLFSIVFGYIVLKDQDYFEVWLGGSGDINNIWKDYPAYKLPPYAKEYYQVLMGYHLGQLVLHLMEIRNPGNDFADMILHHFVTMGLVTLSYVTNVTAMGQVVFFIHDLADFPGAIIKVVSETTAGSLV
jgi:acyl-CoA-dependent ceramide synthase